ncbi:nuclear valosin-containing protein-like isoform X2 [Rhagoletis pomonella]|uniref:nuclear valosin-containing protein-like isoform X2 n=1 Tax=Rhagoletis pomonella TaxID=28610 RepID=UPI001786820B|nr:nuclear valosin-containing protein-like isoform X2 [Rhagoletis pomonella]
MKKTKPILHDPLIINRVKQYLEENVDKKFLDVSVMTRQLMERYPEYTRRKQAPFRALVEQAYRVVSQSYGLESQPSSADESDGSDLEVMDDSVSGNLMNNLMNNLYQKPKGNASKPTAAKQSAGEAIDISSDDDSADDNCTNGKSSDGNVNASSTAKSFSGVILTKSNAPVESSSKGSSTSATTETTGVLSVTSGAQKRHEFPESTDPQQQPNKKQKNDRTALPYERSQNDHQPQGMRQHLQQQQQQQQQNQRFSRLTNCAQASDPASGPFPTLGSNQLNQLRQRKFKKEVVLRKSRETFQDIGGMEKTLKELCELLMHIKSPDIYFVLGLMPPRGLLLHGPPGCGKTLLAHAISGQLNLPLIEVAATELIAGVSGESEERIRDVFEQATIYAPSVLFIDEIDAISSNRSMAQKDMERRIVSQLISSLDNLKMTEDGQSVLVIGATTRPDVLDPALRRVGRFDHEVAIGIPSRKDRKDILTIICYGLSVDPKCDFDKIAELTPGYVGADLLALVSRAATIAVKKKCAECIRAFQLESQRNITIVDLDDEADESADVSSKQADQSKSGKDEVSNETNSKSKEETVNEEQSKDKNSDAKEADADAEKKTESNTNGSAKETSSNPDKKDTEAMDVDDEDQESTKGEENTNNTTKVQVADSSEKPTEEVSTNEQSKSNESTNSTSKLETIADTQNSSEPSLLELLNWLDNPPSDLSYATEFCITVDDFLEAVKVVQPSSKREGFITVPDVTWADVGSLHDIREELQLAVLAPVKFPEKLITLGLTAPSGVLLCGPPGCGKTLLAKAIANEAGINFISVKGPELMNMYVGESERAVRACFQRARNSAPCVIFFDEFDSLCPKRSDNNEGGSGTRVVNQLLTEMDGVEERKGVYILAASNRPDIIDPAILRPGRLDTILYVGLPQKEEREEILKATTKNRTRPELADDVDFAELAENSDGYTGADLAGLVRQAAMLALKESIQNPDSTDLRVRKEHFDQALKLLRPSVTPQDRKNYEKLRLKYAAPRIPTTATDNAE